MNVTKELAEILGLLCAEGCHVLSHSSYWGKDKGKKRYYKNQKSERIEFYNKDEKLLFHYKNLLLKEFDYNPNITKHGKINICKVLIIRNILCHTALGHLKWQIPKSVTNSDKEIKIAFLRGFFDGDGTASGCVRMFSTNYPGIKQLSQLLNDLSFKHTIQGPIIKDGRKPSYIIQISRKEEERFLKGVDPISKRPDLRG
ncbi:MAG: hypothetical protein CMH61_02560 [Nanoarchaeota archaeon]|mgnify:CR=1 FL=1|nr:hypothetical protein [Nanoarchaeota archaeon]|tara:strand:+ start:951 stop:1550 length:600 start_codon:yes stop_codon:yes gene_type:complete